MLSTACSNEDCEECPGSVHILNETTWTVRGEACECGCHDEPVRLDEPGELAAHLADAGEVPAQRIGYRSGIWPLEWHCHFCDADVRPHIMLVVGGISWYCPKCGGNFDHESTRSLDGIERMRVMQALHREQTAQEGGQA